MQISKRLLRKIVGEQGVLVNGQPAYITSRVKNGDLLKLVLYPESSETILPEPIPFTAVYEDDELLVVDKPAGIVVHPTTSHYTGSLANGIVHHWQQQGEIASFRPIHRIDKQTSGLLVVGKNHFISQQLSTQLKNKQFKREYLAIANGVPSRAALTIDAPIMKREDHPVQRIVSAGGQRAVTHLQVLERFPKASLLKLQLDTGRTHQIRVHLKHVGHPLIGDDLYGNGGEEGIHRQALHAAVLGFIHPRTGQWLEWESPMPADMRLLLEHLRTGHSYN